MRCLKARAKEVGSCVNSYIVHSSLHSKTFIGETDELGLVYSGKSLGDKTHLELKKDQNYENFLEQHVHDKANRGITGGIKSTSAVPWSQRERGVGGKQDIVDNLLVPVLHWGMKWRKDTPTPQGVVVWLGCSPSMAVSAHTSQPS